MLAGPEAGVDTGELRNDSCLRPSLEKAGHCRGLDEDFQQAALPEAHYGSMAFGSTEPVKGLELLEDPESVEELELVGDLETVDDPLGLREARRIRAVEVFQRYSAGLVGQQYVVVHSLAVQPPVLEPPELGLQPDFGLQADFRNHHISAGGVALLSYPPIF